MVIFRLPNQNSINFIEEGIGFDEFIIAPFLKNEETYTIKGSKINLSLNELNIFFNDLEFTKTTNIKSTSDIEYKNNVNLAIKNIKLGDFEKVVVAQNQFIEWQFNLELTFKNLLVQYPEAYVFAFIINNVMMMGASPELLLSQNENGLKTLALGGTKAGEYTQKEYSEHQQIKQFIEKELELLDFEFKAQQTISQKAGQLEHLSTTYELKPKMHDNHLELLNHLHPSSAICGLPQTSSLKFIIENETIERGFYSGYLGQINSNEIHVYVNLRCAQFFKNGVVMYAGAGINSESNDEAEWIETLRKIDTFKSCLV